MPSRTLDNKTRLRLQRRLRSPPPYPVPVKCLPKTRSGKIVRGTMCRIADGKDYVVPANNDDPGTLDEITAALGSLGYPRSGATA